MILLDMDGVCFDMLGAIKKRNNAFKPEKVESYDFKQGDYGISRKEVLKLLAEPETFSMQSMYRGIYDAVYRLSRLGKTVGYTSVPEDCVDIRRRQIDLLGIDPCVFIGKKPVITSATVVIDDDPSVLDMYKGMDTKCFLVSHTYNKDYNADHVIRVDCVGEAVKILEGSK